MSKKVIRKILSFFLIMALILPSAVPALAAEMPYTYLEGNKQDIPENLVYFGVVSQGLKEQNHVYGIPIYRGGDLSQSASVTIRSLDISATYGKDYLILEDNIVVTKQDKTILELAMTQNTTDAAISYDTELEVTSVNTSGAAFVVDVPEIDADDEALSYNIANTQGKSKLALMKEAQTGVPTRDMPVDAPEYSSFENLTDDLTVALGGSAMQNLIYSSETVVNFAAGEDVKYISLRILADSKAEGNENLSLVMVDSEGVEISTSDTCSIIIEDSQEAVKADIGFSSRYFYSEDGVATVKVVRKTAEYSMIDVILSAEDDTAVNGTDYEFQVGRLVFNPYEMEKTIEIPVFGSGKFDLYLTPYTGCKTSGMGQATVFITEENNVGLFSLMAGSNLRSSGTEAQLSCTIDDQSNYVIKYTKGSTYGKIYDTNYEPNLEVGVMFFPAHQSVAPKSNVPDYEETHQVVFTFNGFLGDEPNWWGHKTATFDKKDSSDFSNNIGYLYYYSTWVGHEATMYGETGETINPLYYQCIFPSWKITTVDKGWKARFEVSGGLPAKHNGNADNKAFDSGDYSHGKYNMKTNHGVTISPTSRVLKRIRVSAADEHSGKTPAIDLWFYGAAAMYKQYKINVENPNEENFITYNADGANTVSSYYPATIQITSGEREKNNNSTSNTTRNFHMSGNLEKSNIQFTYQPVSINNYSDIYGYLDSYTISYKDSSGNTKTATYPEDFKKYMEKASSTNAIDYSQSARNSKINSMSKLDNVALDTYFADWIGSLNVLQQKNGSFNFQELTFKPKMSRIPVTVDVWEPEGTNTNEGNAVGKFKTSVLTVGKHTNQFYAGDVLDLSVISLSDNYEVKGYQVSTDGGSHFDTITSAEKLVLKANTSYTIRPVLSEIINCVEIQMSDEAKKHFKIVNRAEDSLLRSLNRDDLLGKDILLLDNSLSATAKEKISPIPGNAYYMDIAVLDSPDSNSMYIPVITDTVTKKTYKGLHYDFYGRQSQADNLITVDVEVVPKSSLSMIESLNGTVGLSMVPIRSDANRPETMPLSNYSVSVVGIGDTDSRGTTNPLKITAITDINGSFVLENVYGVTGGLSTLVISNGMGTPYIVEYTHKPAKDSSGALVEVLESMALSYPTNVPRPITVSYRYANSEYNFNLTENTVHIYDNTLYLTVQADSAGRDVYRADFYLTKKTGERVLLGKAYDSAENPNIFTLQIDNPPEVLSSGSRLSVQLLDSQKLFEETDSYIAYPEVSTGLVFMTEYIEVAPKYFEMDAGSFGVDDIPIIGSMSGQSSSGVTSFNRVEYPDKSGFTLNVNVNAFINNASLTTQDKMKKTSQMFSQALNSGSCATEDILVLNEYGQSLGYNSAASEAAAMETLKNGGTEAKNPFQEVNKSAKPIVNVNIIFTAALEFIRDDNDNYIFYQFAVLCGGTLNFNKSFYTVIYGVPCFFNITGYMQMNTKFGASFDIINSDTYNNFSKYDGNVIDYLDKGFANSFKMGFIYQPKVKLQGGVGVCGVVSARGYGALTAKFDICVTDIEQSGAMLEMTGGIGLDLLITSIDIDCLTGRLGFGSLKVNDGNFGFYGPLNTVIFESSGMRSAYGYSEDTEILAVSGNEVVSMRPYGYGTSDMSGFGNSGLLRATLEEVKRTVLLDNAAERTRPQIVDMGNGCKFMVFIGKDGTASAGNEACLFYSVSDKSGTWSTPVPIESDGTFDTTPALIVGNDKVAIAWADANATFTATDTPVQKLNKLGISLAKYDIKSNTMGAVETVVDDEFCNFSPQLVAAGKEVYCIYVKRDLGNVTNPLQLTDWSGIFSTMAYKGQTIGTTGITAEERYIVTNYQGKEPLILGYDAECINLNGTNYMVSTFEADLDNNWETHSDREVFLEFVELDADGKRKHNRVYYPIQITSDNVSDTNVKLTKIKIKSEVGTGNNASSSVTDTEKLYLSWIKDGNTFKLLDVEKLGKDLFVNINTYKSLSDTDIKAADWYKKTSAELGLNNTITADGKSMNARYVYDDIAHGIFEADETSIFSDLENELMMEDYTIVTDGKDVYVLFIAPSEDPLVPGNEIYGMRYVPKDNSRANRNSADTTASLDREASGFRKAVQITNYDHFVMDEISAVMDEEQNVSLVSNYFKEWIDNGGKIRYGQNQLVEIEFKPVGSVSIDENSVYISDGLVAGKNNTLTFDIVNDGMLPAKGVDVEVTLVQEGTDRSQIHSASSDDIFIDAGESYTYYVTWEIPENLGQNALFEIKVKERNVSSSKWVTATEPIVHEDSLKINDFEIVKDKGSKYIFKVEVQNIGNRASTPSEAILYTVNKGGKDKKEYSKLALPAIASGETKEISMIYEASRNSFNDYGIAEFEMDIVENGKILDTAYQKLIPMEPVVVEINKGAESVSVRKNSTLQLNTEVAPMSNKKGRVIYTSSDNGIASVSQTGVVTGHSNGTAIITAHYPTWNLKDSIAINVTSSSSGSSGTKAPEISAGTDNQVDVKVDTKVSNGTATATITEKQAENILKEAEKSGANEIVITSEAKAGTDVKAVDVKLPANFVTEIAKIENYSMAVSTPIADISLSNESLKALNEGLPEGTKDVTIEVKQAEPEMPESEACLKAVEVSILADGNKQEGIGGKVALSIPVSEDEAAKVKDTENVTILQYKADNTVEVLTGKISDGKLNFEANNASKFVVVSNGDGFGDTADYNVCMETLQNITVNHEKMTCDVYNIDGYNYFKLRDIANVLKGLNSEFSVNFDDNYNIIAKTDETYQAVGGEGVKGENKSASCVKSLWTLTVDNYKYNLWCYNIGGNNYFQLRALGVALGFNVDYDAEANTAKVIAK